ncbi:hypothetical protein K7887_18460 [Sutcliffiella horikoshii]|uniref:hypothetical protein n=1 Tax=Sutcliffiella horikoshii TaxID=79883 RepID=UPI001CC000CF|nr:hypothetical protein [Sutcliffiella horikoshii]UAL46825.1 hypothetical protein K7887_18460 [Sutcliffiella horikoshii]
MIKAAIEYIVGLGNTEVFYENGQAHSSQILYKLEAPVAAKLTVHSLSGLVSYLKSHFDSDQTLMVHVESPTEVTVFTTLNGDRNREYLIKANAMLPQFHFENWYDPETFIIKLQSGFVSNEDKDIILKVVGNIKEEDVKTYGDDGISQSVTAKVGVATVGQVEVPNPVALKPYRTFVEVQQPESNFVFRMKNGPRCALFEADGGAWKLEAMGNIKRYLNLELSSEIEGGKIIVIA